MNQLTKFGLVLGVICLIATLVLAVTYEVTKPKIEAQGHTEEGEALRAILPEAGSFTARQADGIEYFDALKGNSLVGYCIKVTGNGYGGFMRIIVGVDTAGVIKGVRILEHQETPGLGSKINEAGPGEGQCPFLRQFIGHNARTVAVKKDIDAITGATISSRAVTEAINKTTNEFFSRIKR